MWSGKASGHSPRCEIWSRKAGGLAAPYLTPNLHEAPQALRKKNSLKNYGEKHVLE
jgi:hypothetical protein